MVQESVCTHADECNRTMPQRGIPILMRPRSPRYSQPRHDEKRSRVSESFSVWRGSVVGALEVLIRLRLPNCGMASGGRVSNASAGRSPWAYCASPRQTIGRRPRDGQLAARCAQHVHAEGPRWRSRTWSVASLHRVRLGEVDLQDAPVQLRIVHVVDRFRSIILCAAWTGA